MKTPWEIAHDARPKMHCVERTKDPFGGPDLARVYRCEKGHEIPLKANPFDPAYGPGPIICLECEGRA